MDNETPIVRVIYDPDIFDIDIPRIEKEFSSVEGFYLPTFVNSFQHACNVISRNPTQYKSLEENFSEYRYYKVFSVTPPQKDENPDIRIVFYYSDEKKEVYIHAVGRRHPRPNVYGILTHRPRRW